MSVLNLHLLNSYFEMSLSAAKYTSKLILNSSSPFFISFPGGSTPVLYFKILAGLPSLYNHWHRVFIFQGDERLVQPDSHLLNSKLLDNHFFAFIPHLKPKFFKIDTSTSNPHKIASDYASLISSLLPLDNNRLPSFDLTVLGLGNDGHTASVFPESQAVHSHNPFILPVPPPTTSQPCVPRITMTIPLINASKNKLFLLSGLSKLSLLKSHNISYPFTHVTNPIFFASIHNK